MPGIDEKLKSVPTKAIGNCLPDSLALWFMAQLDAGNLDNDLELGLYEDIAQALLHMYPHHLPKPRSGGYDSIKSVFQTFLDNTANWWQAQELLGFAIRDVTSRWMLSDIELQTSLEQSFLTAAREHCAKAFDIPLPEGGFAGDDMFARHQGFKNVFGQAVNKVLAHHRETTGNPTSKPTSTDELDIALGKEMAALSQYWHNHNNGGFQYFVSRVAKPYVELGDIEAAVFARKLNLNLNIHQQGQPTYVAVTAKGVARPTIHLQNTSGRVIKSETHWEPKLPEAMANNAKANQHPAAPKALKVKAPQRKALTMGDIQQMLDKVSANDETKIVEREEIRATINFDQQLAHHMQQREMGKGRYAAIHNDAEAMEAIKADLADTLGQDGGASLFSEYQDDRFSALYSWAELRHKAIQRQEHFDTIASDDSEDLDFDPHPFR